MRAHLRARLCSTESAYASLAVPGASLHSGAAGASARMGSPEHRRYQGEGGLRRTAEAVAARARVRNGFAMSAC